MHKKWFDIFIWLFSTFAHNFVAIESLTFSIMQDSIFIAQESSQYLGFKINPYVNRNGFFTSCKYKHVLQIKLLFAYTWKYNDCHQQTTTCTFLYIQKAKQMRNVFIYNNLENFQKVRQLPLRFYIQKAGHFTLHNFSWKFWGWYLYAKKMTLCVTWRFNIQKSRHLAKSKTICVAFLFAKIRTLSVTQFMTEFLILAEVEGHF